jgi:uncharacterized protein YggE
MRRPLCFVLPALLLAPVFAQAQTRSDSAATPSITVGGEGEMRAKPDQAEISVGVVTEAETAEAAVQKNNEAMEKLLDALRRAGIAKKDVQTTDFNVSPIRDYDRENKQSPRIVGYRVVNQVQVQVHKLDRLGEILDTLVQHGANQIHGVSFSIGDEREVLDQARLKAMANARRKAQLYAEAADAKLGHVLSIEEISSPAPPRPMYAPERLQAAAASAVPVAPGEQTLTVNITVTYKLSYDGR